MHLITLAHHGEAQGVIEGFKLTKKDHDLFVSDHLILLITGEGPFEAATKTALTVGKYPISTIVNLGIAGSLNPDFPVGSVHPVRTIYLLQDFKPQFKTFHGSTKGLDCLTTFERILDSNKAQKLRGLGELVDRECWGVAQAAKTAGIPFTAWKVISDAAGTLDACELVQTKAQEFSQILCEKLKEILQVKNPEQSMTHLQDFYFTFTSQHRFNNLLTKLSIKNDDSEENLLKRLPLEDLRKEKLNPKERSKRLLEHMEDLIDPTKKTLESKKKSWEKSFIDHGFMIKTDPTWERTDIEISFKVSTDLELKERIRNLSSLSVSPFEKLMNGELNVE